MVRRTIVLFVATALALLSAGVGAQLTPFSTPLTRAGYEKIHRESGVTVYSHKKAKALHFAAEARFAATPAEVQKVLLAYKRQVGHIGRLSEARMLERRPGSLLVYLRLDMPIISDRDYTLDVRWDRRDEVRRIFFKASRRGPRPRRGVVRMALNQGSWQLRPVRGGRATLARYQLKMDIAGWVPTWLVRRSAGKAIPEVFGQFSRMLVDARKKRP